MKRVTGGPGRLLSFLGLCVLVLIVISGMACQKKAPSSTDTSAPKPQPAAKSSTEPNAAKPAAVEPQIDKAVATVNGKTVGEAELSTRVATTMRQLGAKLASLPPQYVAQVQKQIRQQSLEALVTERLLDEQVAAAKINITDEDVAAEITKTGAQQNPPITLDDFKARVEAQGGKFEEVKNEFRKGVGYRKLLDIQWGDKVKVSDEEAKQYYDSHAKEFETPEEVRASHILVKTEPKDPNGDPNQAKVAAKAKAEKLLKQVKDGGDFAAIAKENSDCPSAAQGGDLGSFTRGKMVKPFEDAAFAMKPGQVSNLVETEFGYHIIKVTEHKDVATTPFEEVKAAIVERLAGEKKNPITKQYIQSLRDKAKIVYAEGEGPAAAAPAPKPSTASQPTVTVSPTGQPAAKPPAPSQPAPQPTTAAPAPQPTATPPSTTAPAAQPAPAPAPEPNKAKP